MFDSDGIMAWVKMHFLRKRDLTRSVMGTQKATIAGGVVTVAPTTPFVVLEVDTEGAAAADDLDTLNGSLPWQIVIVKSFNDTRDVTVKDNTGNLRIVSDMVLNRVYDTITLIYYNGLWLELARSDNAA